jgi:hypothetical protein
MRAQSRAMSFAEAATNVIVGYAVALLTQVAAFPIFGLSVSLQDNLLLGAVFTAMSLLRSYALRRLFERLRSPPELSSDKNSSTFRNSA